MQAQTLKFWKYVPTKKPQYAGKFCSKPYEQIQIDNDGDVMLCGCERHMPYAVGNIYQDTISNIWQGESAAMVRQSVANGDFTYCDWSCPFLHNLTTRPDVLPSIDDFPLHVKIDLDMSCNLKCPSCREHVIIEKNNQRIDQQKKVFETIVNHAQQNPNKTFIISPIASGEIFASHSGLAFLESLKSYPHNNIKLVITSNGTLFMKNQDLIESLRKHIWRITVSIDAATPETYAQVRGGNWEELQQGLRLFQKKLTSISFVVQEKNYHEIEQFAALGLELGTRVFYHKFHNWGHWTPQWWKENNVIDRTKPNFQTAIDSLIRVRRTYGGQIGLTGDLENYITKALT